MRFFPSASTSAASPNSGNYRCLGWRSCGVDSNRNSEPIPEYSNDTTAGTSGDIGISRDQSGPVTDRFQMDVPLHTSPIGEKYKEFIILKKGLACNSKKWPSLSLSALHLFGDRGSDVIHEEFSYIEKSIIWETVQTSNDLARRNLADLREYCDLLIEKETISPTSAL